MWDCANRAAGFGPARSAALLVRACASSLAGTIGLASLSLLLLGGCATAPLAAARTHFYRGDFERADQSLAQVPAGQTDRILVLMERGRIRQSCRRYEASTRDWQEAVDLGEKLDYYSLSQGTASLAINDTVMNFLGAPYERTLVHAFAAKSYLAMSMWDDAAVEARNIIRRLENLYGFPDDAYSHYLAGFCLEMSGDPEGAAFQYRAVAKMANGFTIGESDGHIALTNNLSAAIQPGPNAQKPRESRNTGEVVCFVAMGRTPTLQGHASHSPGFGLGAAPYAELYCNNQYLGRTYAFSDTGRLLADTERRLAALRLAKEATRIAAKEAVAAAVSHENELLGEVLRLILFAMEVPDTRQWETLPEWLEIGRMPCPEDMKSYTVVFKDGAGCTLKEKVMTAPIARRGKTFVSFCRDL